MPVHTPTALSSSAWEPTRRGNHKNASHTPVDHSDLFASYFPYIVNLVHKQGIELADAEDVAMSVLSKFIERDALAFFDPEYTTEGYGAVRKAVFRTFLSGFVVTYTQHYRKMQLKRLTREPFSGDRTISTKISAAAEAPGDSTMWWDLYGPHISDEDEQDVADEQLMHDRIRAALALVPRRNGQDRCDLVKLFNVMIDEYEQTGTASPTLIGERLGVSRNTATSWINRLRPIVASVISA